MSLFHLKAVFFPLPYPKFCLLPLFLICPLTDFIFSFLSLSLSFLNPIACVTHTGFWKRVVFKQRKVPRFAWNRSREKNDVSWNFQDKSIKRDGLSKYSLSLSLSSSLSQVLSSLWCKVGTPPHISSSLTFDSFLTLSSYSFAQSE